MIYLDVSTAVHSRAGLGRYAEKLALEVSRQRPDQIALFHNLAAGGRVPDSLQHLPHQQLKAGFKPWRMAVLAAQAVGIPFNRLVPEVSLFHSTEHLLMPLRGVPTVLTVHDLIFKLFPEYHKSLNYWYLNAAMPLYCRKATAIVTISESSKRDIVREYGIEEEKITVIYEAAADHFVPPSAEQIAAVREKHQLPANYLIHLGTIEPRKNLDRLLTAVLRLRQDGHPDLKLVLAGAKGWLVDDFFARIEQEGLQDVVQVLGWVDDGDLPAVIAAASLAVQPSIYEGFGLPLLEHMACGQAVATSRTSSLPELGGEAAVYFDPLDVAGMAGEIGRLLANPAEKMRRKELGLQQAARFSWERTAQETIALYDRLLGTL